jgi:predicted transcriptional regulator
MARSIPNITAAELKILKVLWRIKTGTVRDVLTQLEAEGDEPAYTTVMTMMNQLAAKGALDCDKARQPFVYKPAVRREQVLSQRLQQFLETVFDGQAGELVLRLVEEAELSPEELKRIEAKIEARERETGDKPEGDAR